MASLATRVMAGISAFREAYVTAAMEGYEDSSFTSVYDFESSSARLTRYDVLWAYYQGNAYRTIRSWARQMKVTYGLYTYIRDIYNPANRICDFHQTHIWGGHLDQEAGDGSEVATSLPITSADSALRSAIAQLWQDSKFHIAKDIITLNGSVFGDAFIKVVQDPVQELVYLERVPPSWITDLETDVLGNVTYYELSQNRQDPDTTQDRSVVYIERATLTEVGVFFQTFKNNAPYAWDGNPEEWVVDYPFVPLVHIKHNDVGLDWGWSELFPNLGKFRETDDQASKLSDQVRKMVDAPWLFSGVKPGKTGGTVTIEGLGTENLTNKEITPEEIPALFAHETGARAQALVADLSIADTITHIQEINLEIERAYPELRTSMGNVRGSGDVSGRALLIARQEADDKVAKRRLNYDEGLVRAHRMAICIAGEAGYEEFSGFGFDDFDSDKTFHRIKPERPVFKPHPTESLDQNRQMWTNAHLAERVGVPLDIFLKDQDWSEKRIQEIINSETYQLHMDAKRLAVEQAEAAAEATESDSDDRREGNDGDDDEDTRGDTSGRGPVSGGQDFNVAERTAVEG